MDELKVHLGENVIYGDFNAHITLWRDHNDEIGM